MRVFQEKIMCFLSDETRKEQGDEMPFRAVIGVLALYLI